MKKTTSVDSQYRITIPAEICARLDLKPGDVLVFDVETHDEDSDVTLGRSSSLDEITGSVHVSSDIAGLSWGRSAIERGHSYFSRTVEVEI
jgi:AbrB family looped-hinge helix DNA binding protein